MAKDRQRPHRIEQSSFTDEQIDLLCRLSNARRPLMAEPLEAAKQLEKRGFVCISQGKCRLTDFGRPVAELVDWRGAYDQAGEKIRSKDTTINELEADVRRLTSERDAARVETVDVRLRLSLVAQALKITSEVLSDTLQEEVSR